MKNLLYSLYLTKTFLRVFLHFPNLALTLESLVKPLQTPDCYTAITNKLQQKMNTITDSTFFNVSCIDWVEFLSKNKYNLGLWKVAFKDEVKLYSNFFRKFQQIIIWQLSAIDIRFAIHEGTVKIDPNTKKIDFSNVALDTLRKRYTSFWHESLTNFVLHEVNPSNLENEINYFRIIVKYLNAMLWICNIINMNHGNLFTIKDLDPKNQDMTIAKLEKKQKEILIDIQRLIMPHEIEEISFTPSFDALEKQIGGNTENSFSTASLVYDNFVKPLIKMNQKLKTFY